VSVDMSDMDLSIDLGTLAGGSRRFHVGALFVSMDDAARRTLHVPTAAGQHPGADLLVDLLGGPAHQLRRGANTGEHLDDCLHHACGPGSWRRQCCPSGGSRSELVGRVAVVLDQVQVRRRLGHRRQAGGQHERQGQGALEAGR